MTLRKRNRTRAVWLPVLVALLLVSCGDDQPREYAVPVGEDGGLSAEPEVVVRMVEPTTILVLPKRGDYDLFWAAIQEAQGVLRRNGIELVGSPRCAYFDLPRPEEVPLEERRFEVWLPVAENIIAPPGFEVREERGGQAAYMTFKGPIGPDSRPDYATLFEYVYGRGRRPEGPVVEVYHWDANTPAEEYITEIFVLLSDPPPEVEQTPSGSEADTETETESESPETVTDQE